MAQAGLPLVAETLTAEAFAPFGQVIEAGLAKSWPINGGTTIRHHALAEAETGAEGRAILSIFRAEPWPSRPLDMLERHPLGSQAFMPLGPHPWLVLVAGEPEARACRLFAARADQGVQYATGVWHHPLLVEAGRQDFLVVDREGPGQNLEEIRLDPPVLLPR
ncbi:MAG: ureidoglycolate lyase [Pseudomonadota bacterium]